MLDSSDLIAVLGIGSGALIGILAVYLGYVIQVRSSRVERLRTEYTSIILHLWNQIRIAMGLGTIRKAFGVWSNEGESVSTGVLREVGDSCDIARINLGLTVDHATTSLNLTDPASQLKLLAYYQSTVDQLLAMIASENQAGVEREIASRLAGASSEFRLRISKFRDEVHKAATDAADPADFLSVTNDLARLETALRADLNISLYKTWIGTFRSV